MKKFLIFFHLKDSKFKIQMKNYLYILMNERLDIKKNPCQNKLISVISVHMILYYATLHTTEN